MLDPCEDENEDIQDDDASLGTDSVQRDGSSESDSEVTASCLLFLTLCRFRRKRWGDFWFHSATFSDVDAFKSSSCWHYLVYLNVTSHDSLKLRCNS